MTKVHILDYGEGNIGSVVNALESIGATAIVTQRDSDILSASHLIVPGQGAFRQAMTSLNRMGLVPALKKRIAENKPFLGICLGFQILFEQSEEHGGSKGLGVFPGTVARFQSDALKIPHMGWNAVTTQSKAMFDGIKDGAFVYFVHSYAVFKSDDTVVASRTDYAGNFVSAVQKDAVWGCQFHPEKSSEVGMQLLRNFLKLNNSSN